MTTELTAPRVLKLADLARAGEIDWTGAMVAPRPIPEAEVSPRQRLAAAIGGLAELDKNRQIPDLSRRAGKAIAELLTAMGEAEPGLIGKVAGAALEKDSPSVEEMTVFFGKVVGTALKMKAEISLPAVYPEASLSVSLKSLLNLSRDKDSSSRQKDAGRALGQFLTDLSRVDVGVRDKLVAAGLNKSPGDLTENDLLVFFGRVVGTAVEMKAKVESWGNVINYG